MGLNFIGLKMLCTGPVKQYCTKNDLPFKCPGHFYPSLNLLNIMVALTDPYITMFSSLLAARLVV